mgnify:FL=1
MWQSGFSLFTVVNLALSEATGATGMQQKPAEAGSGAERRDHRPEQDCGGRVGVEVIAAGGHRPEAEHVTAVRLSAPEGGYYERRKPVCPQLSAIFV